MNETLEALDDVAAFMVANDSLLKITAVRFTALMSVRSV